jgi:hypothetical protein
MIRADIYFAFDYLHQKKIVDRLRFSALIMATLVTHYLLILTFCMLLPKNNYVFVHKFCTYVCANGTVYDTSGSVYHKMGWCRN